MKKSRTKHWNPAYAGWRPMYRNGHFDRTAPLTASERDNYIAAMKRLVRVHCYPIRDEALRRWANSDT